MNITLYKSFFNQDNQYDSKTSNTNCFGPPFPLPKYRSNDPYVALSDVFDNVMAEVLQFGLPPPPTPPPPSPPIVLLSIGRGSLFLQSRTKFPPSYHKDRILNTPPRNKQLQIIIVPYHKGTTRTPRPSLCPPSASFVTPPRWPTSSLPSQSMIGGSGSLVEA